jgi:hypothetical protein
MTRHVFVYPKSLSCFPCPHLLDVEPIYILTKCSTVDCKTVYAYSAASLTIGHHQSDGASSFECFTTSKERELFADAISAWCCFWCGRSFSSTTASPFGITAQRCIASLECLVLNTGWTRKSALGELKKLYCP